MNGYTGNILRVDLTSKQLVIEITGEAFYRQYIGGSALGRVYMRRNMPAASSAPGYNRRFGSAAAGSHRV